MHTNLKIFFKYDSANITYFSQLVNQLTCERSNNMDIYSTSVNVDQA